MALQILLMYSNHRLSDGHMKRLKAMDGVGKVSVVNSEEEAVAAAPEADIILGHRYLKQCLPYVKKLKWVQTSSGGYDRLPCRELKEKSVILTRSTFPPKVIAMHTNSLIWALIRNLPGCLEQQKREEWNPLICEQMLPLPKKALILGFGKIGRELAGLLKPIGIEVFGAKQTADEESKRHCDHLLTGSSWKKILPEMDILAVLAPLNEKTRMMVDEEVIRSLPGHAVIVNVGRGAVMDQDALIRCLNEGHLGGAALDVFEKKPEPGDPVWNTPRLIVSPYVAARYPERDEETEKFFEAQVRRYLNQKILENVVSL